MPGENASPGDSWPRFLLRIRILFSAIRVEMSDRSSQEVRNTVVYNTILCNNIKSKRQPTKRCRNPATHGEQCGLHHKNPTPFGAASPLRKRNKLSQRKAEQEALTKIGPWARRCLVARNRRKGGPAFYVRDQLVNDTDFVSMDPLRSLNSDYFFSYAEGKQLYGFDLRSLHTLVAQATALNPYTRSLIPAIVIESVGKRVAALESRKLPVRWPPLDPPTPDQQVRMRIVDLFTIINELNYYSTPDWFFAMDAAAHRQYYAELHSIWSVRAGLSEEQKQRIIPHHGARLFRTMAVSEMTAEGIARLNASTMRIFVSSAEDKNDRVLGAMYVVSALTLVSAEAKAAYPWLYESVYEPPPPPIGRFGWLHRLLRIQTIPFLQLPPRAEE